MDYTQKPRILFVCARNQWRSPTAVEIYKNDSRIEVKSAGMRAGKGHQLSTRDIEWADLIFVMEQGFKSMIKSSYRSIQIPPIISLDIPDDYEFMNEELINLIITGTEYYINLLANQA